jgi:signal transduction histidine kinase/DNA-binding response OmpR family regulator/HAMP domain-containing protein
MMAANLTGQVRNIAEVTTAVANGDLSKKITVDVKGEILDLKTTINTMVDQLNSFASEVTRVAREVGIEGKLGGQSQVKGVAGVWKDLTENVNMMAANLTNQVRGIANVVTAVANGDLKRKLTVDAKGEIAALANTINDMIDTLATFADQVTNVAREVGIEGKLGGQARVPGAAGLWRDLTDNVNQLAANLTTQVRAIAEVATAVTKGDLSRSITVEASGEVASLKDNINEMIRNLKETTQKNTEQDWLKTNLARFTRMLQGERDLTNVSNLILSEIAPLVNAQHGVFYISEKHGEETVLDLVASYAFRERKHLSNRFRLKEGLVGQCAYEKKRILLHGVPGDYIQINSGLGEAPPLNIIVLPVLFEDEVKAVIELASFNRFSETHQSFLDQLMESIGIVLNTIAATMRTEGLLKQSQLLASELQAQQEELKKTNDRLEQQAATLRQSEELLRAQQEQLRRTNEELEDKAQLLEKQKTEVEEKNQEVVLAKAALEEKAEQLSLTSKYKSQFLANMSHELRTPLNSLLILSKLLADNSEGNLSEKQREFASTIHAAGVDLLSLINDILDLSKIESGTVSVEVGDVPFAELRDHIDRTFRQVAAEKRLAFTVEIDPTLPRALSTDSKRLQQVLKNLLSNAFKFTEQGSVKLRIGWAQRTGVVGDREVVAFSVVDTGIGIPKEKQRIIFEAFQQADGTTSRKYGGTGLGLSISREIARLLGGEITVVSMPGAGSTFTLLLPMQPPRSGIAREIRPQPPALEPTTPRSSIVVPLAGEVPDDREDVKEGDRVILIVEDDAKFATILLDLAHDKGLKAIVATTGNVVMPLARTYGPLAITLDIGLPDMDGWALLDQLKRDPQTRHIPVHIISVDEQRRRGLQAGAYGFLEKPVDRETLSLAISKALEFAARPLKNLLLVEDDEGQRKSIMALIGETDVQIVGVASAEAALDALRSERFDCMVVDLALPGMSGIDLIEQVRRVDGLDSIPIVVYTGIDIPPDHEERLRRIADTVIVKGENGASERLLDETSLFLHRTLNALPEDKQRVLVHFRGSGPRSLAGKKVLIIDDDVRNVFSLTSALEREDMEVSFALNGREGIEKLKGDPEIDAVLVDIMMPEMDGYETMRAIRAHDEYRDLPLIAVTAKAMKGDREKCIDAGANDYIAKPVEIEQLISMLRVRLGGRSGGNGLGLEQRAPLQ